MLVIFITALSISSLFSNHFEPAWMFEYPQNPYLAMNFFVYDAEIFGFDLEIGDEIGIFDGNTCVGAVLLTMPISAYSYQCVPINVSMEGGGVPGSAVNGHPIIFKMWKATTQMEYFYPELAVWFDDYPAVQTTFETQGSCFVNLLSYETPTGVNAQTLSPPTGPGGGYVQNVDFPVAGFYLEEIYLNADGGGTMTAYAFNTTPLDLLWNDTPPLYNLNYGWFIDSGNISYYASTTYPIRIKFDLSELSGLSNPAVVTLYRRDIHGTGAFTQVSATYDSTTGYLSTEVTALGEFILGSSDSANAKGILNGYVYQYGSSLPIQDVQVTLGIRTVETDSNGFYSFSPQPAGEYQVTFSAWGYAQIDTTVVITANCEVRYDVYLVSVPQIPSIPQSLIISRGTGGTNLSWDQCTNAVRYHVYCSEEPAGAFLPVLETLQTDIFVSDSVLQNLGISSDRAFFRVTADSN